jgi:ATP-dependent metalloprotease FtsH
MRARSPKRAGTRRRLGGPGFWAALATALLVAAYGVVLVASQPHPSGRRVEFSRFLELAGDGRIVRADLLDQDSYVQGTYRLPGEDAVAFNTPFLRSEATRGLLLMTLQENDVPFRIEQQNVKRVLPYLSVLLPTLILIVVLAYFLASYRRGSGVFATRSGARTATDGDARLRFSDVAGQDAAITEVSELAAFLADPARFERLGARIPKGVLLYGPPGCGKTLLARAIAGESGAAFLAISGSDFVEMYQGVGAARVRELFREAREQSPAILFIDEIDAVARRRRSGPDAAEEQNQALNQLLTEMDGFERAEGTIVVGATNRPDDLDPALLRPGRFDRAVSVDRPDEAGRLAILALHARGKPMAADVDLAAISQRAVGLTGADLESVVNEGALLTARAGLSEIGPPQLDAALARILEAPERQRRLSMRDRSLGQQALGAERVTFADVAGVDEAVAELAEIRDFISDPGRFARMGARFPRGFLLVGPPGCGKTLLARAVAGESNAAFLSVAATEFTEVYVGEGSGRVRDLFSQARALAPAVVFIDEIDAIGARRESGVDGHREREQTLNQILIELDGFRQRDGVVVMAATNRPEILDPALVRAGRFDREITLDPPDLAGRRAILAVHAKDKRLAGDVDLDALARVTRGLSGADLANILNEAALLSARRGAEAIGMSALEQAVERATIGIGRAHVLSDQERRVAAVHEAGHVVVAHATASARMPHMVSIIPSGRSVGRAWLTETHDAVMRSRADLIDDMAILLGGRSAETMIFGEARTTAGDDLAQVSAIAGRMVRELGMSDAVGDMAYPEGPASEETARLIDAESRKLGAEARRRAESLLTSHRGLLERIASALLDAEMLDSRALEALLAPTAQRV